MMLLVLAAQLISVGSNPILACQDEGYMRTLGPPWNMTERELRDMTFNVSMRLMDGSCTWLLEDFSGSPVHGNEEGLYSIRTPEDTWFAWVPDQFVEESGDPDEGDVAPGDSSSRPDTEEMLSIGDDPILGCRQEQYIRTLGPGWRVESTSEQIVNVGERLLNRSCQLFTGSAVGSPIGEPRWDYGITYGGTRMYRLRTPNGSYFTWVPADVLKMPESVPAGLHPPETDGADVQEDDRDAELIVLSEAPWTLNPRDNAFACLDQEFMQQVFRLGATSLDEATADLNRRLEQDSCIWLSGEVTGKGVFSEDDDGNLVLDGYWVGVPGVDGRWFLLPRQVWVSTGPGTYSDANNTLACADEVFFGSLIERVEPEAIVDLRLALATRLEQGSCVYTSGYVMGYPLESEHVDVERGSASSLRWLLEVRIPGEVGLWYMRDGLHETDPPIRNGRECMLIRNDVCAESRVR